MTGTVRRSGPGSGGSAAASARTRASIVHRLHAVAVLGVVLVACGGTGDATPTTRSIPPSVTMPAASSLPSDDPELEALLPDQIGGEATQKLSMAGDGLVGGGTADETFVAFLERIDADPEDVSVAYAWTLESEVQAFAYRVAGAATTTLLRELEASVETEDAAAVTWEDATIGGKRVRYGSAPDATDASIFLYGHEDVVFIVVSPDPDLAAEVASGLP